MINNSLFELIIIIIFKFATAYLFVALCSSEWTTSAKLSDLWKTRKNTFLPSLVPLTQPPTAWAQNQLLHLLHHLHLHHHLLPLWFLTHPLLQGITLPLRFFCASAYSWFSFLFRSFSSRGIGLNVTMSGGNSSSTSSGPVVYGPAMYQAPKETKWVTSEYVIESTRTLTYKLSATRNRTCHAQIITLKYTTHHFFRYVSFCSYLAQFFQQNNVLEQVFGKSAQQEILKRSGEILRLVKRRFRNTRPFLLTHFF